MLTNEVDAICMLSSLETDNQVNHEFTCLVLLSYIHQLGPNRCMNVAVFHPIDLYIPGLPHQQPRELFLQFRPKAT